jgi:dienelactone hydrolase
VPCLHSDPKFPDCGPGETKRLRGWLSFYEGRDIEGEFRRIDRTGWRQADRAADSASTWKQIAAFFTPPAEFANDFGSYKSLLTFHDGTTVKSAADGPKRRAEILEYWMQVMGPWPAMIEKPKIQFLEQTPRENFTQHRVRVEIAARQMAEGYLLIPDTKGPFPAVLVPYYEPETSVGLSTNKLRDFGYQLARRGFVTLSIGSPGGDARKPAIGGAACQPLSFLAYAAANCCNALAALPEVDPKRIGVVGHSYGGKWAMFAACLYDRFACGVWSDPGIVFDETRPNVNYWEPWYLGYETERQRKPGVPTPENPGTGAYQQLIKTGHDLHELLAVMAPRPFLVSGGSEDPPLRWQALNHVSAVNRLLGHTNRVSMTNRPGHTPTAESNEQIYLFFEYFLKEHP